MYPSKFVFKNRTILYHGAGGAERRLDFGGAVLPAPEPDRVDVGVAHQNDRLIQGDHSPAIARSPPGASLFDQPSTRFGRMSSARIALRKGT